MCLSKLAKYILMFAARSGSIDVVKYLVEEKELKVNTTDEVKNESTVEIRFSFNFGQNQKTVLMYAAEDGNIEVVKYLVEQKGADLTAVDKVR